MILDCFGIEEDHVRKEARLQLSATVNLEIQTWQGYEWEDFHSWVWVKLVESDYAAIGKFEGRGSLRAFLAVVLNRYLLDYRVQKWGRWRPSTKAKQLGPHPIDLEFLIQRHGYSASDAVWTLIIDRGCPLSEDELHTIATRLPVPHQNPSACEIRDLRTVPPLLDTTESTSSTIDLPWKNWQASTRVGEESLRRGGPESLENLVELGFRHLEEGELQEALRLADQAASLDENCVEAHEVRALALTLLGRIDEADGAFSHAAELDPEDFFRPFRLEGTEFDDAVEQTLLSLPPQFREYLENVEVGVEDTPAPDLIAEGLEFDLLGIYIGDTTGSNDWDFPDRVVLFQRNIENISPDRETLLAEIRDTLLHEMGHHFGMDEDTLREIEDGDEA